MSRSEQATDCCSPRCRGNDRALAAWSRGWIRQTISILTGSHQKLDPVQIHCAVTNRPGYSNRLVASGWEKFNLNFRSQRQIRHGKQAHPDITQIDAKSIHVGRAGEYLDGSIQQLPLAPTPVVEVLSENHQRETTGYKVARWRAGAKITEVQ